MCIAGWIDWSLIKGAFRYGFSNKKTAISFALAFYIMLIPLSFLLILSGLFGKYSILTGPSGYVISLLISPIILGYMARCARNLLDGNYFAPYVGTDLKELLLDGLKLFPIYLIVSIILWAIAFLPGLFLKMPGGLTPELIYYSVWNSAILLIPSAVLNFMYMLQIVNYTQNRAFTEAINPVRSIKLMIKYPGKLILPLTTFMIVNIIVNIVIIFYAFLGLVNILLAILIILAPFFILPMNAIYIYIVTEFYRVTGKNDKYSPQA